MKILIATLNAKYTHTSLSARCLFKAAEDICTCCFKEYTINDSVDAVASDIYKYHSECVAFSCYIWNIEFVLKIASLLKKANPNINIVLGGHEVEHNPQEILASFPFVDAVLLGEGEISFRQYAQYISGKRELSSLNSIAFRQSDEIVCVPRTESCADIESLPFVYDDSIKELKDKIIYYESSRGCPYNCTYCISGEGHKVRFLSTDRVKRELKFFMDRNIPLVKFVDRTFNADKNRAKEIFKFIADNPSDTCFHMELSGALIDDETLEILSRVKKGTLQFEIGVQTTNERTLEAISRKVSYENLKYAVERLMDANNIHIHLDLIAGLPYEDLQSFKKSFNDVIALRPHVLQLGFLKLLKGSKIRAQQQQHGYVYQDCPPYEVISNNYMDYSELMELKITQEALDRYYNSGNFKNSLGVLFSSLCSPYTVFKSIGEHLKCKFPTGYAFSKQALFEELYECFGHLGEDFSLALKKDYLMLFRPGKRPSWMGQYDESVHKLAYEVFKDEEFKKQKFPFYCDVPAKEIMKHIHAEKFGDSILFFDHKRNEVYTLDVCDVICQTLA